MPDVCVVGSLATDLVVTAPRRPGQGETVVGTGFATYLGGKGFNQAVAAARSGARTAMIGRIGADDRGRDFLAALERNGIDSAAVRIAAGEGTGVGLPLVEPGGANSIVVVPLANGRLTAEQVGEAEAVIAAARVLLLQLEVPGEASIAAARIARRAGTLVLLNPAPVTAGAGDFAGLVDVLVPNEIEATQLTGISCAGQQAGRAAAVLRERFGADVIVTLGSRGALVGGRGLTHMAALPADCVDSTGGGDAFCGAVAALLASGATLEEAARHGNAAGALAVSRHGAEPAMPRRAEIDRLLQRAAGPPGAAHDEEEETAHALSSRHWQRR